jgi:hypothetical protein
VRVEGGLKVKVKRSGVLKVPTMKFMLAVFARVVIYLGFGVSVRVNYMLLVRYCRTEGPHTYTVVMYRTRSDVESTAETLRNGQVCKYVSADLDWDASMPRINSVALMRHDI